MKQTQASAALALLLAGCATSGQIYPSAPEPFDGAVNWNEVSLRSLALLTRLSQIDTSNPGGNVKTAALALQQAFKRTGIEISIETVTPNRTNVFAKLAAQNAKRTPLLLLSHLDAYAVEPETWPKRTPPFGATVADGAIWSRGVLDGKGVAVLHAMTMILLKQQRAPIDRDVLFAATFDGVRGGESGMPALLKAHPEITTAEIALTKGGMSIDDLLGDGRVVHSVAVAEKGLATILLTAVAGKSGGRPREAGRKLAQALSRIFAYRARPELTDPVIDLLRFASKGAIAPRSLILSSPLLTRIFLLEGMASDPSTRPLVTDTIEVTRIHSGSSGFGRTPGRAHATIRCGLLPGTTVGALKSRLRKLILDPDVHISVQTGAEATASKWEPRILEMIGRRAQIDPKRTQIVVPSMATEASNARFLREAGIAVYGFAPFLVTPHDLDSIRGSGEHVSLENLQRGVKKMVGLTLDLAASR